jgi:hypothetical protein
MKAYLAKQPRWVILSIVVGILLAGVCVMVAFVWLFVAADASRPISQLPWFFWLLVVFIFLARFVTFTLPSSGNIPISEMSVRSALLRIAFGSFVLLTFIVTVVNGSVNGTGLFLAAFWLPTGIRGAAALLLRWRLQSGHSAVH